MSERNRSEKLPAQDKAGLLHSRRRGASPGGDCATAVIERTNAASASDTLREVWQDLPPTLVAAFDQPAQVGSAAGHD